METEERVSSPEGKGKRELLSGESAYEYAAEKVFTEENIEILHKGDFEAYKPAYDKAMIAAVLMECDLNPQVASDAEIIDAAIKVAFSKAINIDGKFYPLPNELKLPREHYDLVTGFKDTIERTYKSFDNLMPLVQGFLRQELKGRLVIEKN